MVLDVIRDHKVQRRQQERKFMTNLLHSGDQKPLGLRPSGFLVTLMQAHKALSKVFCSLSPLAA